MSISGDLDRAEWTGTVARLDVPTQDGRVLVAPADEARAFERMPVPLSLTATSFPELGVAVGQVVEAMVSPERDELRASGVVRLSLLPDGLRDALLAGEEIEAGVAVDQVLTETRDGGLTTMSGWVLRDVTFGLDYRSAWSPACTIKLAGG
jgi:hypothetical protein